MAEANSVTVQVRYFAAARAAAGTTEQSVTVPAPASVADVLLAVRDTHSQDLARVLDRCSYLLDEIAVHDAGQRLADGATLDVLPPFAGG